MQKNQNNESSLSGDVKYDRRNFLELLGIGSLSLISLVLNKDKNPTATYYSQEEMVATNLGQDCNSNPAPRKSFNKQNKMPNIIFILGDNHQYRTMGCGGHPFVKTPGMDRLAREGVMFDNTFSTTPLCSPSRASILTGTYAHKHGVKNNHTPWTGTLPTFLENLSQHGYATAFIGKWHMPGEQLPQLEFLDHFVSYTYREGQGAYFNCPLIVDGQEIKSRRGYITEIITDYSLEFMEKMRNVERDEGRPFCIFLGHRPGHPPYEAPPEIRGLYRDENVKDLLPDHIDPWWYGKANRNIFEGVMMGSYYDQYRKYCETITAMDRDIQRLLEYLDITGLSESTVVIYMGDNGMQWGTHDCHGIREPYEDSIRLPLIVRAPWLTPRVNLKQSQMVLNLDIAPTLLELAGISIPNHYDGISLVPILRGDDPDGRNEFLLEYWRYFPENTPSYRGIRTNHHKLIEFERGRKPMLFNLMDDPEELINLYESAGSDLIIEDLLSRMASIQS
jgi:N-acetylglucosamine-6-sulfatase